MCELLVFFFFKQEMSVNYCQFDYFSYNFTTVTSDLGSADVPESLCVHAGLMVN